MPTFFSLSLLAFPEKQAHTKEGLYVSSRTIGTYSGLV